MRFQNYIYFGLILTFSIFFAACEPTPEKTGNTSNTTNKNAVTNTATTKPTPAMMPKVNEADTIKPVIEAYYQALVKKDDAALRKVYSQAALKELDGLAKSDKAKNLVEFIESYEPTPIEKLEIRNEKIEGDTGFAELKGGSLENWTKTKFVKENGEWKFAPQSESMKNNLNEVEPAQK